MSKRGSEGPVSPQELHCTHNADSYRLPLRSKSSRQSADKRFRLAFLWVHFHFLSAALLFNMLFLGFLVGLLAASQASADCFINKYMNTSFTGTNCNAYSFFSPTTNGQPTGGQPCLKNQTYSLTLEKCPTPEPALIALITKCPAADSDGYLAINSDYGTVTLTASNCVKGPMLIGYGLKTTMDLVEFEKPFDFAFNVRVNKTAIMPTTTKVATTAAVPTKPPVTSSSGPKLDIVFAVDRAWVEPDSMWALKSVGDSFSKLANPSKVNSAYSSLRMNPYFWGGTLINQNYGWNYDQSDFSGWSGVFWNASTDSEVGQAIPTDYTQLSSALDLSFGSTNKNTRDHTTRVLLLFVTYDSGSDGSWAKDYIQRVKDYDVHTVIVPFDSEITNITAALKEFKASGLSVAPIFADMVNSTSFNADEVAKNIFNGILLNGATLCNANCVATGKEYKFPNVANAKDNYCVNTYLRCSMQDLFGKVCDLSQEATITMKSYDIYSGFDTLNFYEMAEVESFSGFHVSGATFATNLTDGFFVFNSTISSVYGGFRMTVKCDSAPGTPAPDASTTTRKSGSTSSANPSTEKSTTTPSSKVSTQKMEPLRLPKELPHLR
ncbi:hypothetical protein L596_016418 [Steinernema carpocapsae]|uniref:VWFA domain-containing protein n=1 Tax=Steinernema carpocapsae TaxID=34508 RepID=A0A4U5NHX1_STECR|nr:hypothetical protein L596_016418 [Steinernema carpocapsae]